MQAQCQLLPMRSASVDGVPSTNELPAMHRRQFLALSSAGALGGVLRVNSLWAAGPPPRIRDTLTISRIPRERGEIEEQHKLRRAYAAEQLPESQPFEVKGFAPALTARDEAELQKRVLNTSTRRHAWSVGLEMAVEDQQELPVLSRDQILKYLRMHFVSMQARIYREPVSRQLYLGPRVLAATLAYQGARLTQEFTPTVAESVDNMRSLGLFVPEGQPSTPFNLRTLVMVHRNELVGDGAAGTARTNYEYVFVRAREQGPDQLELHTFATSEGRTRLHWLDSASHPGTPSDCSLRGSVRFTEFTHQGLYPSKAVIRRSLLIGKQTWPWSALEAFARRRWDGDPLTRLTDLLDALIAGDVADSSVVPEAKP